MCSATIDFEKPTMFLKPPKFEHEATTPEGNLLDITAVLRVWEG